MKLPGWCRDCRRVRTVSVSGHALATARARGSHVVEGVCDECRSPACHYCGRRGGVRPPYRGGPNVCSRSACLARAADDDPRPGVRRGVPRP